MSIKPDGLEIHIADSRTQMGQKAAKDIAAHLRSLLQKQQGARIIFAAAPSQSEMLHALCHEPNIDWPRVTAFHMDEYLGLPPDAPQRFGAWLRKAIFDKLPFGAVHLIEPGSNPQASAKDYAEKLAQAPIDIVCLGIGVNGHLAFNDPPANLNDPEDVKIITLSQASRQQQVDDQCFASIEQVPTQAITLTIPRLLNAGRLYCTVPGKAKQKAVKDTLEKPISAKHPSTALRQHPNCNLYLDQNSKP